MRRLAAQNQIPYADLDLAWQTSCNNIAACDLYHLPEGLHPNSRGYDAMAQTVMAALLGIDIFSESGAQELAGALGLPVEAIVVKPIVASSEATAGVSITEGTDENP
jgi:hypothetical protein